MPDSTTPEPQKSKGKLSSQAKGHPPVVQMLERQRQEDRHTGEDSLASQNGASRGYIVRQSQNRLASKQKGNLAKTLLASRAEQLTLVWFP